MNLYFKVEEIDRDTFIKETGEDLTCLQMAVNCDGVAYIATVDSGMEDVLIPIGFLRREDFEMQRLRTLQNMQEFE